MKIHYTPFFKLALPAFLLPMAASLNAQEDPNLIAYEGFDYAVDESLEFKDGGTGWGTEWRFRLQFDGKGSVVYDSAIITEGSLSYNGLVTSGNHVHLYGDFGDLYLGRALAETVQGQPGTSTYISFLAQRLGEPVDPNMADPWWDDAETPEVEPYPYGDNLYPEGAAVTVWNSINSNKLAIGNYFKNPAEIDSWIVWGGGLLHATDQSFANNVSLVVVRVDHVGSDFDPADKEENLRTPDNIYMWINPDLSQGEDLGAADLALIGPMDVNDDRNAWDISNMEWIGLTVGDGDGARPWAEMILDELRIGTTWDSVTPHEAVDNSWNGYPVDMDGIVHTDSWLGSLYVEHDPWIYSFDLQKYLYLPPAGITSSGGWTFLPQNT